MKDYGIKIEFAYFPDADKAFSDEEKRAIRNKIADTIYNALRQEVGDFMEIDNINKRGIVSEMTIYVGDPETAE